MQALSKSAECKRKLALKVWLFFLKINVWNSNILLHSSKNFFGSQSVFYFFFSECCFLQSLPEGKNFINIASKLILAWKESKECLKWYTGRENGKSSSLKCLGKTQYFLKRYTLGYSKVVKWKSFIHIQRNKFTKPPFLKAFWLGSQIFQ